MPSRKSFRVGRSKTGLGLFATELIKKRQFIVEYRGQRLTSKEADRRADLGARYLYEINTRWTVDGANRRNVARYVNHSCRPNAESDVNREGKIIIRAYKNIKPGEEITYDYGIDYFNLILKPMRCKCGKCPPNRLKNQGKSLRQIAREAREKRKAAAREKRT